MKKSKQIILPPKDGGVLKRLLRNHTPEVHYDKTIFDDLSGMDEQPKPKTPKINWLHLKQPPRG